MELSKINFPFCLKAVFGFLFGRIIWISSFDP